VGWGLRGCVRDSIGRIVLGYAKLFANEPEDVWLQRQILKLGTRGFDDASDALHDAERRAKRAAAELREPHFEGLWRTLLARAMGQCWGE
jgi:hypothetical protein